VKLISGETEDKLDDLVLTYDEKSQGNMLSCNAIPKSDLELDVEDLGDIPFYDSKIVPAKIASLHFISDSVLKLKLRLPPNVSFKYNAGQYVNISKGIIKRSYSISNAYKENGELNFYIKDYFGGEMSQYWLNDAKVGDLLRIEGPKGSFFFRESNKQYLIFLATGTGIAPVMAIVEELISSQRIYSLDKVWILNGARFEKDLFWNSDHLNNISNIEYIPVLSKLTQTWKGEVGYVQDILLSKNINLSESQVYACGSDKMIRSALKVLVENGLDSKAFYSDAFVATN
jgi:CDP-4-dehydro-6-deoxyglucose reductase